MRIGRIRVAVAALGALALVTATARCGSAQEKDADHAEEHVVTAAPFVLHGSAFGGGSYLGVYISEVHADDVSRLELGEERGALIEDVTEDGPAEEAGIRKDDVIVEWNGTRVESAAQLQRLVKETPAGREVRLGYVRDGDTRQVAVTIAERESLVRNFSFRTPDPEHMDALRERLEGLEHMRWFSPGEGGVFAFMGGGRMGIGIQSLGDQLGAYFGLDGREGVLVTSVREDSPAEAAGMRAGDVIISVGGEAIDGTGDLARMVREADAGPISVGILRDRDERTLTVERKAVIARVVAQAAVDAPDHAPLQPAEVLVPDRNPGSVRYRGRLQVGKEHGAEALVYLRVAAGPETPAKARVQRLDLVPAQRVAVCLQGLAHGFCHRRAVGLLVEPGSQAARVVA